MRTKIIKILAVIGGILLIAYVLLLQLRESFTRGERRPELNLQITKELLDSSAAGLDRFRAKHGHFPQIVGKYFFDSIKTLVVISDVYVYADSLTDTGGSTGIKKPVGKHFDFLEARNTYLGAGRPELTIIYRPLSLSSYILYGVGENGLDEGGKGDDIKH